VPLHSQLERKLRADIRAGRLLADTRLPASRTLSRELGVARGCVVEAYEQLVAEGFLTARGGSGTRVATIAQPPPPRRDPARATPVAVDLRPGMPSLAHFPRAAWLRATRRVFQRAPDAAFASYDARGAEALREALAGYLNRARGAATEPDSLIVCTGATQGVALLARTLRRGGATRVAVEDPGYPVHRAVIAHAGLEPVPVPVDDQGISATALREQATVDAVVVTPAHQYPTAVGMSPTRRAELVEWAQERETLIVEDDYDGEFRYDRQPLGALQGLAPERVAYLGSVSKVLAPGLRLGWLALPAPLLGPVAEEKALDDLGCEVIAQLVLADLISSAELDRQLRRMRRIYKRRRDVLVDELRSAIPDAAASGLAAGLQALVLLPPDLSERAVVAAAAARGLAVTGLGEYRVEPVRTRPALVIGYANVVEERLVRGVRTLAECVEVVRAQPAGAER
jgi:GntR family transcriptional regulator/MocR family aminotransferase